MEFELKLKQQNFCVLPQLSQGKLTWKNSIGNVHFICNSGKQFYLQPDCNNKKSI